MATKRKHLQPPIHEPRQEPPGSEAALKNKADHGETSYVGCDKLRGKVAIITGGDSGIGRSVAIAFAREGADVLISYLNEHEDAQETAHWVKKAGRKVLLIPGDITEESHCKKIVSEAIKYFKRINILVNNAAYQRSYKDFIEMPTAELERTFQTNVFAMFYLTKAVLPHLREGDSMINTSSINADSPNPTLLAYAATKAAITNFTAGLAQSVAKRGIRVNSVAPGPIWTPLIVSTLSEEKVKNFGEQVPFQRPGQPAEVAPAYVLLASDEASYISGVTLPVTGGKPML
jgi:NAD(P)-dependent dehydrogenase (short-subunit alcohol dehydrogenase family)